MTNTEQEQGAREIFRSHLKPDGPFDLSPLSFVDDDGEQVTLIQLLHPWSDKTLALIVPDDVGEATELANALSRVDLPPKFSAVWHKDTEYLEILWTAFEVRDKHKEVSVRSFDIWWREQKHDCYFGPASREVLTIARATLPCAAPSHTEHRNIISFHTHARGYEHQGLGAPLCFWINCKGLKEESFEDFIRTINLYMTYYDRETPRVLIHETNATEYAGSRPRYVQGEFPKQIVAREVDPSIVSFWLGVFDTRDPAMKYLLHYRLIEYLSLSHIKADKRSDLINILRRPHLISSPEAAASEIASIFATQAKETDRIKAFVEEAVAPEKVWKVLEMNKDFFSRELCFDGGYSVKPLLSGSINLESWKSNGPRSLVDKLRAIRNCLAHGQDEGTKGVIHATQANRNLLSPWINLIETISAEAMLYSR